MARADEGLPKLWLLKRTLEVRRADPAAFDEHGGYRPLEATGPLAEHVIAFARGKGLISLAPRWVTKTAGGWQRTSLALPEGNWINAFGDATVWKGSVELDRLLSPLPVALLVRQQTA